MAYSTTAIDINRGTSNVYLTPEMSGEIWGKVQEESVFMRMARQIGIPGNGLEVDLITADAVAVWTAESTEKQVSKATLNSKVLKPYKLSVIELFSDEFARDKRRLYDELVRRLPNAIAAKFDKTISQESTPGTGFDVLSSATAVSIAAPQNGTVYGQLVTAFTTVANAGHALNGWIFAPQAMGTLLGAVDGNGRPIFLDSANDSGAIGRILGAPVAQNGHVYKVGDSTPTPNLVGIAGDWNQAVYGIVDGIRVDISSEATINDGTNQINLWQRNMFAVKCEAEVVFGVRDANAFVRLTTPYSA